MKTKETQHTAPEHTLDFKPGLTYRISVPKNSAWWGPRYVRHSTWLREMQGVLANLCMLSGGSGSVVNGLAACAAEENKRAKSLESVTKILMLVAGVILFLEALVISEGEPDLLIIDGALLVGALLLFWFLSYRMKNRTQGAAWKYVEPTYRERLAVFLGKIWRKLVRGVVVVMLIACVLSVLPYFPFYIDVLEITAFIVGVLSLLGLARFFYVLLRSFAAARREAIYLKLRDDVLIGLTLAEAMARIKRFFPRYYSDIAKVGEDSGQWQECMKDLSTHAQQYAYRYAGIRRTMIYLFLSFAAQVLVLLFLAVKVLPVFVEIHNDMGSAIPAASKTLIETMDLFIYKPHLLLIVPMAIVLAIVSRWLLPRRARGTRFPSGLALRIPLVKRLVVYQNVHLVSYMLSRLLEAGVPLKDALATASQGDLHHAYRKSLLRVREQICGGTTISEAFEHSAGLYTNSFCTFVRIGERSGMLPESLSQLSERFGEERDRLSSYLSSFVAPFFMLVLGTWTLFIMVGIFSMLFSLSDAIIGTM